MDPNDPSLPELPVFRVQDLSQRYREICKDTASYSVTELLVATLVRIMDVRNNLTSRHPVAGDTAHQYSEAAYAAARTLLALWTIDPALAFASAQHLRYHLAIIALHR